jgi:hypothetical protein
VNKKFNIEREMDGIFKEGLENSISQVPPGVWESVSSSIGSAATGTAVAGAAAKTAVWMKAAIASLTVAAVASVTYFVVNKDNEKPLIQSEKTVSRFENNKNEVIEKQNQLESNPSNFNDNFEIKDKSEIQLSESKHPENASVVNNDVLSKGDSIVKPSKSTPNIDTNKDVLKVDNQSPSVSKTAVEKKDEVFEEDSNALINDEFKIKFTENEPIKDSSNIVCPNVITPNGDGKNDCYEVILVNEESFLIQIYDLKMNKLYESTNKYKKWCCELPNGGIAPAGSYLVVIKYKFRGKAEESKSFLFEVIK